MRPQPGGYRADCAIISATSRRTPTPLPWLPRPLGRWATEQASLRDALGTASPHRGGGQSYLSIRRLLILLPLPLWEREG